MNEELKLIIPAEKIENCLKEILNSNDIVSVVRCKDCKYRHWLQDPRRSRIIYYCDHFEIGINDEFFCAIGEPKSEGG